MLHHLLLARGELRQTVPQEPTSSRYTRHKTRSRRCYHIVRTVLCAYRRRFLRRPCLRFRVRYRLVSASRALLIFQEGMAVSRFCDVSIMR